MTLLSVEDDDTKGMTATMGPTVKSAEKTGLSATILKHTAILLMFLNHFSEGMFRNGILDPAGWYRDFQWHLTRAAFILFAFLIAEGMAHTGSRRKYMLRLLGMGVASEFFYDELFYGGFPFWPVQNVFFTLFFGALAIAVIDRFRKKPYFAVPLAAVVLAASSVVNGDYGLMGVAVILLFYYLRGKKLWMYLAVTAAIFVLWFVQCWIESLFSGEVFTLAKHLDGALLELHGILAFPLIHFYDGRKGKQLTKEFYYLFYPGHLLLILMLVRLLPKC